MSSNVTHGVFVAASPSGRARSRMCADGSDATRRHVVRRRLSPEGRTTRALRTGRRAIGEEND